MRRVGWPGRNWRWERREGVRGAKVEEGQSRVRQTNETRRVDVQFVTLFVGCFVAHHSIHHSSLLPSMDVSSFFTRLLQVPKHTPSTARPDHLEDFDSAWQSIKVRKGQSKRNNRTYSSSNNRKLWSIRMRGNWCGKMSLNQFNEETR